RLLFRVRKGGFEILLPPRELAGRTDIDIGLHRRGVERVSAAIRVAAAPVIRPRDLGDVELRAVHRAGDLDLLLDVRERQHRAPCEERNGHEASRTRSKPSKSFVIWTFEYPACKARTRTAAA